MARKPYNPQSIQVEEGKWYLLDNPECMECCDCSLVHHTEFKLIGSRIFWRTTTDAGATAIKRRENGIKVVKAKSVRQRT